MIVYYWYPCANFSCMQLCLSQACCQLCAITHRVALIAVYITSMVEWDVVAHAVLLSHIDNTERSRTLARDGQCIAMLSEILSSLIYYALLIYLSHRKWICLPFALWIKSSWIECFWIIKIFWHVAHHSWAQLYREVVCMINLTTKHVNKHIIHLQLQYRSMNIL